MPMKKMKTLISTMLCLCAVFTMALPAHALSYDISAPGDPEYGKPTSFEPVVTADGGAMKNEDLSTGGHTGEGRKRRIESFKR